MDEMYWFWKCEYDPAGSFSVELQRTASINWTYVITKSSIMVQIQKL